MKFVRNKKFIRIMAIILASLFLLTGFASAFFMAFAAEDNAEEVITITAESDEEAEDMVSSASQLSGRKIRVALFFKNSSYDELRMNHSISSETGFRFYMNDENGKEVLSFSSPINSISVIREDHVAKNSSDVYESVNAADAEVSRFAMRMKDYFPDEHSLKQELEFARKKNGYDPFYPILQEGKFYIGVGDFSTQQSALDRYLEIKKIYPREFALKSASDTYLTVIDNSTGRIVLRADTSKYPLCIEPNYKKDNVTTETSEDISEDGEVLDVDTFILSLSPGAENIEIPEIEVEYDVLPYIVTAKGNIYAGTFEYSAASEGMTLINIVSIDDYIKSVVPYEIFNNWPEEAIKAFSIAARTYALTTFHKNENFDMCSETHCQAYLGRGRSTPYSDACVDATSNMILTYNGEPAHTFYHAIAGGATESAFNVWGSSESKYPYLMSIATPWEKYSSYSNGFWSSTVTMKELSDYILSKESYASKLSAPIKDIEILETQISGYVTKVRLILQDGSTYTVTTADRIRIMLSKYVKSSNFIFVHGIPIIKANSTIDSIKPDSSYSVLTASGEDTVNYSDSLYAITDNGISEVKASNSLQIIGKGYGHGVGLSQYGTKDMADLGYTYDQILATYYPGTVLTKYVIP